MVENAFFKKRWVTQFVIVNVSTNTYFVCHTYNCAFTEDINLADTFSNEEHVNRILENKHYQDKLRGLTLEIKAVKRYV